MGVRYKHSGHHPLFGLPYPSLAGSDSPLWRYHCPENRLVSLHEAYSLDKLHEIVLLVIWCTPPFVIKYIVIIKLFMAIDSLVPRLLLCRKPPFSAGEEPGYEVVSEPDPRKIGKEDLAHRLGGSVHCGMLGIL